MQQINCLRILKDASKVVLVGLPGVNRIMRENLRTFLGTHDTLRKGHSYEAVLYLLETKVPLQASISEHQAYVH